MMTSSILYTAVLTCHPETCSEAVRSIEAPVCWTPAGTLVLSFVLKGDISRLRIPPPRRPRRADLLWQHTCFEAFVAVKGKPEYYEFNFAPSGEWAAYAFRQYRDGAPIVDEELAPSIRVRTGESFQLDAIVRLDRLPNIDTRSRLRLGLSAIIEENDGKLFYWALKHPVGKPDFHHPDASTLELDPPDVDAVNDPAYTAKR
jgi:hypothetical protein